MRWSVSLALLLIVGTALAGTPAEAQAAALADVQSLSADQQQDTRWLSLYDIPPVRLEAWIKRLQGHVNGLSRSSEIVPLVVIDKVALLRLNLKDYNWSREVWEQLKDVDPYFHAKVVEFVGGEEEEVEEERIWRGGPDKEGNVYPKGFKYKVKVKKRKGGEKKVIAAQAPWLDATVSKQLFELTGSQVPIVYGPWFLYQTAIQADRKPGYYDFLEIKNQKEFEEFVGFQEKTSRKFADLWREAVARSGVNTGKRPRRIEAGKSLGAFLWRTLDSRQTKDKFNPLRVLDDALLFDATEQFAPGPNGMMIWYLGNNKGERQDSAPDFIASDQQGAANDSRVHVNLSCIRCHTEAGFKSFDKWARTLFQPPRQLTAPDYNILIELRRQYLRNLEEPIADTRTAYARAIFKATGWEPKTWAKEYYAGWEEYAEAEVDLAWAARSLGTTEEHLHKALEALLKQNKLDLVLSTFVKPPAQTLSIETWEELYPLAQAAIRGLAP